METLKSWFEEKVLNLGFVQTNLKNAHVVGFNAGSKSQVDIDIEKNKMELLTLVKRIEDLTYLEDQRKNELDERLNDYVLSKTRNADNLAESLAEDKLNALLSSVDLHKIVKIDKTHGILYIGDERAEPGRLNNLKNEAEFLIRSDLWTLLYETPKELAQRAMFVSSESLDDLKKGKSILYALSTQRNIIDVLLSYTQKPIVRPQK